MERGDPATIAASQATGTAASQADISKVNTEESDLAPVVTAKSEIPLTEHSSGNAEAIARRVFSSPVENEISTAPEPAISETKELINATSNVEEAPVVKSDIATVPATEPALAASITPAPEIIPSTATKLDTPVAARVAPPISVTSQPTATTETTVSGPSTSSKGKESKGVSSWLKTKFRRTSRITKPENSTSAADSKEKGFVGGANLTAPETRKPSSDQGDSSMREVAMAGKDPTAASQELSPVVSPNDEDLYSASTHSNIKASGAIQRQSSSSPSISSLSSDEDTRGRSNIPRDRQPLSQREFLNDELKSGEHVDPDLVAEGKLDPNLLERSEKGESSSAGVGEEFEEARDTFDSEKLSPPDKSVVGGKGRTSDSPARDSKFIEEL